MKKEWLELKNREDNVDAAFGEILNMLESGDITDSQFRVGVNQMLSELAPVKLKPITPDQFEKWRRMRDEGKMNEAMFKEMVKQELLKDNADDREETIQ